MGTAAIGEKPVTLATMSPKKTLAAPIVLRMDPIPTMLTRAHHSSWCGRREESRGQSPSRERFHPARSRLKKKEMLCNTLTSVDICLQLSSK